MRKAIFAVLVLLFGSANARAGLVFRQDGHKAILDPIPSFDPSSYGIPKTATVIETRMLRGVKAGQRGLVLWMPKAEKHEQTDKDQDDEPYTCPEEAAGFDYYEGFARLSLVDPSAKRSKQTLDLAYISWENGAGNKGDIPHQLPFKLRPDYAYAIVNLDKKTGKGTPVLMDLRDFDGDGEAFEFPLFEADNCMSSSGLLAGYDPVTDKVIQYDFKYRAYNGDQIPHDDGESHWASQVLSVKARKSGDWCFVIDWRGREGNLELYKVQRVPGERAFQFDTWDLRDDGSEEPWYTSAEVVPEKAFKKILAASLSIKPTFTPTPGVAPTETPEAPKRDTSDPKLVSKPGAAYLPEPWCFSLSDEILNSDWELFSKDGNKVATYHFGTQPNACVPTEGREPSLYILSGTLNMKNGMVLKKVMRGAILLKKN